MHFIELIIGLTITAQYNMKISAVNITEDNVVENKRERGNEDGWIFSKRKESRKGLA